MLIQAQRREARPTSSDPCQALARALPQWQGLCAEGPVQLSAMLLQALPPGAYPTNHEPCRRPNGKAQQGIQTMGLTRASHAVVGLNHARAQA